jgi:multiple sugar transport system substrate-binding protein
MAPSAAGPEDADTFAGAGYFGLLRGTDQVEACVNWLEFLSRPENMQRLSLTSGNVSPMRQVMQSESWSDSDWKKVATVALEDAHTSQQPSPSWSAIAQPEPGAVLYDMVYDAVVLQKDLDETIARAQERMQDELDRTN